MNKLLVAERTYIYNELWILFGDLECWRHIRGLTMMRCMIYFRGCLDVRGMRSRIELERGG